MAEKDHLSPSDGNFDSEFTEDDMEMATDEDFSHAENASANDGMESAEQARINELEDELARVKDHMIRALADAENTRKRAQKDREDAGKFAITSFARDLLSFADNFTRALDAIPEDIKSVDPRIENVVSGIEAMEKELLNTFEKHGIQKLDPMDQPFDPNFHEVMFETPIPGKAGGTVIQIIEPGYTIKERLLRPARVGIAKAVPGESDGKPGGQIDTEA